MTERSEVLTDATEPTVRYWRHPERHWEVWCRDEQPYTFDDVPYDSVQVLSDAELAAIKAEVAEQARADERERIARVIESKRLAYVGERPPVVETRNSALDQAARIARTPDPNGDTP